MKEKTKALRALIRSKTFVLITEEESVVYVDLTDFSSVMQLTVLKQLLRNIKDSVKEFELKFKKGE